MSPFIYDIAVILIMLVCIGLGYKRGVLRTVLNLICFAAAFLAASSVSSYPVTSSLYDRFLHETVSEHINSAVKSVGEKAEDEFKKKSDEIADEIADSLPFENDTVREFTHDFINGGGEFIYESIPDLYNYLNIDIQTLLTNPIISDKINDMTEKYSELVTGEINRRLPFGITVKQGTVKEVMSDEDAVEAFLSDLWGIRSEDARYGGIADYLEQNAVRPVCIRFIGIIVWAAVFAAVSLVLRFIIRIILIIRNVSPVKTCDSILGAAVGAAAGAAVTAAFCTAVLLTVIYTGGTEYMNEALFSKTLIFGKIYNMISTAWL